MTDNDVRHVCDIIVKYFEERKIVA
jgi:hypothetical protein